MNLVATPGRHVEAKEQQDDADPFEKLIKRCAIELRESQNKDVTLEIAIAANLKELSYGE